jgi:sulfonate transport system substrate-binding protein
MSFLLHRRHFLSAGAASLLAACSKGPSGQNQILQVGDQRGGSKVVLEATHALDALPYHIEWSAFPNAAPLLEALNAGAIDTGIGGDAAFIFAIGSGAKIKAIGAQRYVGPGPVIVVRGDSPIRTIDQIAGKRIATPRGSISHNLLLAAMEAQGKPLDAVKIAFLSPQDGQAALQGGSVDGWAIWDPNATMAVRQGARIVTGSDGLVPSYALMFGRDGAIEDKRPLLADYHRRLYAGWDWAAANGAAYSALLAKETGVPIDIWQAVTARTRRLPAPIDATLIADQQKTADRYFRAGLIEARIDVKPGFDSSFS